MTIWKVSCTFLGVGSFFVALGSFAVEGEDADTLVAEFCTARAALPRSGPDNNHTQLIISFRKRFVALGPPAIAPMLSAIRATRNMDVWYGLFNLLGDIPGEEVQRTLFQLMCFDSDSGISRQAASELRRRLSQDKPATQGVSEEMLGVIIRTVREGDYSIVADRAYVLALCLSCPEERRMKPIEERFLKDIARDADEWPTHYLAYTSPRVIGLSGYLGIFKDLKKIMHSYFVGALRRAHESGQSEGEKWLALALGFSGEPSVAECLKNLALHEPDRYVRHEAVQAYAGSAGKAAIPVLRELVLHDKTRTEYGERPFCIIASAANEELLRLGVPKKEIPNFPD